MYRKAIMFLALAATAASATTPVAGITAEKLGLDEADFVSPEAAKPKVMEYYLKISHPDRETSLERIIIFPYVVEDWNEYDSPPPFAGDYEVTVYAGEKLPYDDDAYFAKIEEYVNDHADEIVINGDDVDVPKAFEDRERLTEELFPGRLLTTRDVSVNSRYLYRISQGFDGSLGFNALIRYFGAAAIKKKYAVDDVEYLGVGRCTNTFIHQYRTCTGVKYFAVNGHSYSCKIIDDDATLKVFKRENSLHFDWKDDVEKWLPWPAADYENLLGSTEDSEFPADD